MNINVKGKQIRDGNKYRLAIDKDVMHFILTGVGRENLAKRQRMMVLFHVSRFGLIRLTDPVLIQDSEAITHEEFVSLLGAYTRWVQYVENYEGEITL